MFRTRSFVTLATITLAVFPPWGSAQLTRGLGNEALGALESHHFHQAVRLFSVLVKREPSAANFAYLAIAENGVKDFAASIADYERAIKLGGDSLLTRFGLGTTYLEDGKPLAAARELQLAIDRDPGYMPARYALGVALLEAKQPRQATSYLESARKASEGYARYWLTLVEAEFEAGSADAAVKDAQRALVSIPARPALAAGLAALCAQHQQWNAARNLFETALELQPANFKVRLALARVCLRTGDPGESLQVLGNLPTRAGDVQEVVIVTTEARALTGNIQAAKSRLGLAIQADPGNPRYLLVSAWLDETQGHYRRALAVLTGIHHAGAMEPHILYQIAVSHYFLHQYALAESTCAAVARLSPNDGRTYSLLGLSRLAQGEAHAAKAAFEKAVTLDPKAAAYRRELGEALLKEGALQRSEAQWNAALTLDPRDAETYYWQAQTFARLGQSQRAIDSLQTAIVLDPEFALAYSRLSALYLAQGEPKKAKAVRDQEMRWVNAKHLPENRPSLPATPIP
jgi:tetratricopeptide (TPR) repeat protein